MFQKFVMSLVLLSCSTTFASPFQAIVFEIAPTPREFRTWQINNRIVAIKDNSGKVHFEHQTASGSTVLGRPSGYTVAELNKLSRKQNIKAAIFRQFVRNPVAVCGAALGAIAGGTITAVPSLIVASVGAAIDGVPGLILIGAGWLGLNISAFAVPYGGLFGMLRGAQLIDDNRRADTLYAPETLLQKSNALYEPEWKLSLKPVEKVEATGFDGDVGHFIIQTDVNPGDVVTSFEKSLN